MNILLIPDSFKDSLSASEVAAAMERGIKQVAPNAKVLSMSASDGGEGFIESVAKFLNNAELIRTECVDPLGRPIASEFLLDHDARTAYIELARASGLELLQGNDRNPMFTSTFGTGMQIKEALKFKPVGIYVGLGGSATNDGGVGIAEAMGYQFLDSSGETVKVSGERLPDINSIISSEASLNSTLLYAINDVRNPLLGHSGAAYTYARQKGASDEEIEYLDGALEHLADLCRDTFCKDLRNEPGAGAAGGTAFGLKTFLGAEFISGVSFFLKLAGFEEVLNKHNIDLIITGEGKIDTQTSYGKMVSGIANEASKYDIPVAAVCGKLELNTEQIKALGLIDAVELFEPDKPIGYSFLNASTLIEDRMAVLIKNIIL